MSLANRVAIVTGASRGIGRAIVHRLHKDGAKVAICDIDKERGEILREELKRDGGIATFIATDCTQDESIKAMVDQVGNEYGRIDILVNNAAAFVFGHCGIEGNSSGTGTDKNITTEGWEKVLQTNIMGYSRCIQHVVPWMRRNKPTGLVYKIDQGEGTSVINAGSRGAIVNIASISALIAQPEFMPYNTSKAGVLMMTKCCALDLAEYKIRVNAVSPGTVETPASYSHMRAIGIELEEGKRMFGEATALRRQAAPEEIANGVAFLASDEASYMTGSNIIIDGGQIV
mmetsp:Transcript_7066/g.13023  ORF Transcript_7066/g.13023 Transcript_7066/m.13023 type:complete len:287 (-) Transcript_7066:210-1070(-)